ncbi:MAG: DUF1583 domain-containing protein [Pirellulales bacterium]
MSRKTLVVAALFLLALATNWNEKILGPVSARGQDAAGEADAELERQKKIIERFVSVLEKNPRRGTALDRIYGFHIEWGTLDAFVAGFRERAEKKNDGIAWMVLGLIESQRGRDAAAVEAFTKADESLAENAMASYYLGQSLVLVGQPEKAAEAFERAIERRPAQPDLLDIFQALGRVHQRAQRNEQALAVWSRLEKLFPGDARVQEQIAATLVEEGQLAAALPRYETLVKLTTDDYRRAVYRMEAAELKVKLGKSADGIADLEQMLAALNPESWLFREVRRKIEEVFLRGDDQDGLSKYYQRWVAKYPEDVDAMARLARVLARQARVPEAQQWLEKALKLAPSRKDLRLAFIDQLVDDQRYAEAIAQYEALDKAEPHNPDHLREWGKLILRDTSRPKEARQKSAETVWRRLTAARPKDALAATQVADLFRQAEMPDQALELYAKAAELAPADPQYREYLGEFYHIRKEPQKALATWREIAAGKNRTAENLARLAEVLSGFGYLNEATAEIAAACELEPKEFALQLKAADLFLRTEQHDQALEFVATGEQLAANAEEAEAALALELKVLQAADTLKPRSEALAAELSKEKTPAVRQLLRLARYYEALHDHIEAIRTIDRAIKLEPQSIPSLATAARIQEQSGNLALAAELNRKLAAIDRRFRTDYLTSVARLESQLGRIDEALQAGRDLIAAAPGNSEHYEFFAQMCFRLGRAEEGLDTLRRAVRVNPGEPALLLTLAAALAEQIRTDEAIELYWQAFEKSEGLDEKINVVMKLTDLYLQTNHLDRLFERLERDRREADRRRELTICLAQAHHSAGDFGAARSELESLLSEDTRDTALVQQLSKLAEGEQDIATAIKYQEQLAKLAPGAETEYRLANLLARNGQNEEATAIFVRLIAKEEDPEKLLQSLDSMISQGQNEQALGVIEARLREQPQNWELLYRQAYLLAATKPEEATPRLEKLLAFNFDDDELGALGKARERQLAAARQRSGASSVRRPTTQSALQAALQRLQGAAEARTATGIDPSRVFYGPSVSGRMQTWMPQSFGQARMAALAWLLSFAEKDNRQEEFLAEYRKPVGEASPPPRAIWDWIYLTQVRNDGKEFFRTSKLLAQSGEPLAQAMYLYSLAQRTGPAQQQVVARSTAGQQPVDRTPPLADDEIELMLKCYRSVNQQALSGDPVVSYQFNEFFAVVTRELKRANRTETEEELRRELLANVRDETALAMALSMAAENGEHERALELFENWSQRQLREAQSSQAASAPPGRYVQAPYYALVTLTGRAAAERRHEDVLAIVESYLAYNVGRSQHERSRPIRRSSSGANRAVRSRNYVQIAYGATRTGVELDFPSASVYHDVGSIALLRTAFEAYKRNDLLSDLVAHFQRRLEQAEGGERLYRRLELAYLQWWNEERNDAVKLMTEASAQAPTDIELRMQVAQMHLALNQLDEALVLADSITPLDHTTLQQKETMALDLAVRLGDAERARQAAERLFGLRLDANTQVQLAGQMRRLGMNEMAENLMARAERQAGNQTTALVTLMNQRLAENKPEVAAQIAHQILRRTPATSTQNRAMGYSTVADSTRTAALQCLTQTGKLKELIARIEEQIKASPTSVQLYQTLSEYYQMTGNRDKALESLGKSVEARPSDALLRFQYAQQLAQNNKHAEACDQYKLAIVAQPNLFGNRYYEIQRTFQQANRLTELASLLDQIDIRAFGQYYYVMNTVQSLINQPNQQEIGVRLFKKAWAAFPQQRAELLRYMYDGRIWQAVPEMYDYARQAIIPSEETAQVDPWSGLSNPISYSSGGTISGMFTQMLTAATTANRLDDLRKEIAAAIEKRPEWSAGLAMLAIIHVRQGQIAEAKRLIESLVNAEPPIYIPATARWMIAQEIGSQAELRGLAIKLLEESTTEEGGMNQFEYSPLNRLVSLLETSGELEAARKIMLKAAAQRPDSRYDAEYAAYQRAENVLWIGNRLQRLGYHIDAIRLYRDLMNEPGLAAAGQHRGDPNYFVNRTRQLLQAPNEWITGDTAAVAMELLAPQKQQDGAPTLDLMLSVSTGELAQARVTSLLFTLLDPKKLKPEALTSVRDRLKETRETIPADVNARVFGAYLSLHEKGDDGKQRLAEVVQLVEQKPLDEVPEGKRPNARQRAEAAGRLSLWLLARECLAQKELAREAETLARSAVEAARWQLEPNYYRSMLLEWGQIVVRNGDKAKAEQLWTELLDSVLARPQRSGSQTDAGAARPAAPAAAPVLRPAPARLKSSSSLRSNASPFRLVAQVKSAPRAVDVPAPVVVPGVPAPAFGGARAPAAALGRPAGRSELVPPVTMSQFQTAMAIAKMAAENDMHALSLRAVRESLTGGLPIADPQPTGGLRSGYGAAYGIVSATPTLRRTRVGATTGGVFYTTTAESGSQSTSQVIAQLSSLSGIWQRQRIPAEDVYKLLAGVVFPARLPEEVLVYPISISENSDPTSIGRMLVEWCVRANRAAELKKDVAARQTRPDARLAGQVLLVQLGLATRDKPLVDVNLGALAETLTKNRLQAHVDLACHAALPAFDHEQFALAAMPVIDAALATPAFQTSAAMQPLAMKVVRYHLRNQNHDKARDRLDGYLAARQAGYARYSGESAIYVQRQDLAAIAAEAARGGLAPLALDYLGRMADMPTGRQGEPAVQVPLWHIREELARMPAEKAYALLRDWTLPVQNRNVVRLVAAFGPSDIVPEAFRSTDRGADKEHDAAQHLPSERGLIDNVTLLIDAARRSGKVDELFGAAEQALAEQAINANVLHVNLLIAKQDFAAAAPKVTQLADAAREHRQTPQGGAYSPRWSDIVTASSAARHVELADAADRYGRILLDHARSRNLMDLAPGLRIEWAKGRLARRGDKSPAPPDAGLRWWFPSTPPGASDNQRPPARWVSDGEYVGHLAGFEHGLLYFQYPLTGDFEFSADGYHGPWAESDLGFGGIVVEAQIMELGTLIWPLGLSEQLRRPDPVEYGDVYNRLQVKVANGSMRYLINGHLVYEDTESSPTAPWLYFYAHYPRHTAFKNIRLTGKPTIPREVTLTHGDRLEGWVSAFYNESQPPRRTLRERQTDASAAPVAAEAPSVYDWQSREGVIYGRFDATTSPERAQSRLYYHRPLRNGDTLRYQFLYQPGSLHVHPGLGRLAFLLDPEGVRLHWMTSLDRNLELFDVGPRNFVEEPENRRGPTPLPLNPGAWNDIEITLRDDTAMIKLNGTLVYQRTLEPENDRRFSLFHYRNESGVQVRNAVLTGDWPKELTAEQIANPLALWPEAATPEARGASTTLVGDELIGYDAYNVWKRARAMPAAERYEYLARWVLPDENHLSFRLRGDFTPIPAPVLKDNDAKAADAAAAGDQQNVPAGGEYIAPAIELARTARKLGRLEELANRLAAASPITAHEVRGKLAMQAIVAAEREDDAAANKTLRELFEHLTKMPRDEPEQRRYPEVTAAMGVIHRPALVRAGRDLLEVVAMQPYENNFMNYVSARWERTVRHLRAVARWKHDTALAQTPFAAPPALKQWSVVDNGRADGRGLGSRGSGWRYQRGALELYPGLASRFSNAHGSKLYFNVPLRGDFEVKFQRTTYGWREVWLAYGALALDPRGALGDSYGRAGIGRQESHLTISPPIPDWGHWIDYRIEVREGYLTAYANDQKFHTERLSEHVDPWLVLGSSHPHYEGTIRNLRIVGNPIVPDKLQLSEGTDLSLWRADYYNEPIDAEGALWQKRGEEIVGNLFKDAPGSSRESLLQYHRPILEDGEIDYEFYHSPNKVEVHPAIDRLAFLLAPDGVQLHVLSDAQFERNGLTPDDKRPLPVSSLLLNQLPLKADDWNQMRVALVGDEVTLALNGQAIVRYTLDEGNNRFFGLFRYSDATEARVRKVSYRGNWKRTLPSVEEQELAAPPGVSPVSIDIEAQPTVFKLSADRATLERQGLQFFGDVDAVKPTGEGLALTLTAGRQEGERAGIALRKPLVGDFEITGKFQALTLDRPATQKSARFALAIRTGPDDALDVVSLERHADPNGQQQIRAMCHHPPLAVGEFVDDWYRTSRLAAGEFRLVRRGSRIYYLVREAGAERFTVIESQAVGSEPVREIELALQIDDPAAAGSVVVEELVVRGKRD